MKTKTFMESIVSVEVFSIAVDPIAPSAFAEWEFHPEDANWGKAQKFLATNYGQFVGDHASDPNQSGQSNDDGFDRSPGRTGLGNLVQDYFDGDWCVLLAFLEDPDGDGTAENDDIVYTCEEQVADE